jgi:integrase
MSINLKDLKKFPGNKKLGGEFKFIPVDYRNKTVEDIPNLQPSEVNVQAIIKVGKTIDPKTGKRVRPLRPNLCLVSELPNPNPKTGEADQVGFILNLRKEKKLELASDGAATVPNGERLVSHLIKVYKEKRVLNFKDAWTPSQQLKRWETEVGHIPLDELDAAQITAAKNILLEGRSPKTVNNYLSALSSCFDYAIKHLHWINANPVKNVAKEKVNNEIDRYMTDEERNRFFEGLESTKSPTLKVLCHFGINTGCRKGEAHGLTWDNIDFELNTISFTKTKRIRTCVGIDKAGEMIYERNKVTPTLKNGSKLKVISMKNMPELRKLLMEYKLRSNCEYVFPQDTQHSFRFLLEKCNIDNFRFHDLRHSCASYLVQSGVPLLEAAHHLGQKDYNSVLRYAHLAEDVTEGTGSVVAARIYGKR